MKLAKAFKDLIPLLKKKFPTRKTPTEIISLFAERAVWSNYQISKLERENAELRARLNE